MSHKVSELNSFELSGSELDEEVVGESLGGSFCRCVTSVRVVVVAHLARGRLILMGTLLGVLENVSEPRNWTCRCVALLSE